MTDPLCHELMFYLSTVEDEQDPIAMAYWQLAELIFKSIRAAGEGMTSSFSGASALRKLVESKEEPDLPGLSGLRGRQCQDRWRSDTRQIGIAPPTGDAK